MSATLPTPPPWPTRWDWAEGPLPRRATPERYVLGTPGGFDPHGNWSGMFRDGLAEDMGRMAIWALSHAVPASAFRFTPPPDDGSADLGFLAPGEVELLDVAWGIHLWLDLDERPFDALLGVLDRPQTFSPAEVRREVRRMLERMDQPLLGNRERRPVDPFERPRARTATQDLVEVLLNGMHPARFFAREDDPDQLRVVLGTEQAPAPGSPYTLPHLTLDLRRTGDFLNPVALTADHRDDRPAVHTRLTGRTGRNAALRLVRSALALQGELDTHLARTHLVCEQVLTALSRHPGCLPGAPEAPSATATDHPLVRLLHPHLRGADAINALGNPLILAEGGVMSTTTGLSPAGVGAELVRWLGAVDWAGWSPRHPVVPQARFAVAQRLFWRATVTHVEAWLAAHGWADDLPSDPRWAGWWTSLVEANAEVVARAVPTTSEPVPEGWAWSRSDRPEIARADRPHTWSPLPAAPHRAAAVQFAAFLLHHATFLHTWTNDLQLDALADPDTTTLGSWRGGGRVPGRRHRSTYRVHQALTVSIASILSNLPTDTFVHGHLATTEPHEQDAVLAYERTLLQTPLLPAERSLVRAARPRHAGQAAPTTVWEALEVLSPRHLAANGVRVRMDA